jgi:hypothetical protein
MKPLPGRTDHWLGGLLQQAHVDDLVCNFLLDDQLVLGVDGELRVVLAHEVLAGRLTAR